ncbi:hypothetical protein AM10699_34030 [Acaryochloris marina MBIC10699]|nr:hypothetical protein AM10699_34030 [Acaryochloris marina MBIC10699]
MLSQRVKHLVAIDGGNAPPNATINSLNEANLSTSKGKLVKDTKHVQKNRSTCTHYIKSDLTSLRV